ncbi:MAG TPA: helix-turn-helix transcriptional regulator [Conexibacter sp.]|nr:helix-turn-helix transcriptional regulator [Conexibacter sp.]
MPRKRSHETKRVMRMLLDAPSDEVYGLEVTRAAGLTPGSAYAILRRLRDEGLLEGRWEQVDPAEQGRPPRYYYRLTSEGRRVAQHETAAERTALQSLAPGWAAR